MITRLLDRISASSTTRAAGRISFHDARARARRGAAYLDTVDPDWRTRIDPERLELSDGSHCVLGQLHGEFRAGLVRTRVWDASTAPSLRLFSAASPEDLGFHARTDAGADLAALDYAYLNRAWRVELGHAGEARTETGSARPRALVPSS
jgi:hypothetical protein